MKGWLFKVFSLGLITLMLFASGCASTQQAKRIEELEAQVAGLAEALAAKDVELQSSQQSLSQKDTQLKEMESSHQNALAELQNQLERYKTQQEKIK
jgi:hypothetical protein